MVDNPARSLIENLERTIESAPFRSEFHRGWSAAMRAAIAIIHQHEVDHIREATKMVSSEICLNNNAYRQAEITYMAVSMTCGETGKWPLKEAIKDYLRTIESASKGEPWCIEHYPNKCSCNQEPVFNADDADVMARVLESIHGDAECFLKQLCDNRVARKSMSTWLKGIYQKATSIRHITRKAWENRNAY